MKYIRVTETPPGDAPEVVRAAWVGLCIPLAEIAHPQPNWWSVYGIKENPSGLFYKMKRLLGLTLDEQPWHGYLVEVLPAIAVLHIANPVAAEWWQRNTPHLFKNGQTLVFPSSCCIEILDVPT